LIPNILFLFRWAVSPTAINMSVHPLRCASSIITNARVGICVRRRVDADRKLYYRTAVTWTVSGYPSNTEGVESSPVEYTQDIDLGSRVILEPGAYKGMKRLYFDNKDRVGIHRGRPLACDQATYKYLTHVPILCLFLSITQTTYFQKDTSNK
jgi:hypothetical protein